MSAVTLQQLAQRVGEGVRIDPSVEDNLMADPRCDICDGLGFVVPDVAPGEEGFGRAVPCSCQEAVIAQRLWGQSGLLPEERGWELDYVRHMAGKVWAVKAAEGVLDSGSGWLVLYGAYGVGKSGVLKAAVAQAVLAGTRAHYRRAEDILAEARETFGDHDDRDNASAMAVRDRYAGVPLLAIDEVDRVSKTDWARSFLFGLLDERYNRRGHVATIMATNAQIGAMGPEWGYLESRMGDGMIVTMAGDSLRDRV